MPPERTLRNPGGRSSKDAVWAVAAGAAPRAATARAIEPSLARKAIIGDRYLETLKGWPRFDHHQRHQPTDQHDHRNKHDDGPELQRGHAKMTTRAEQGHDAVKLAGRGKRGKCRSLETAGRMGDIHGVIQAMSSPAPPTLPRTVALVGLMGAGKSAIGKRLAMRLGLPFVDADEEIERAAGCSIAEFFESYGEAEFRLGERRVIARLLEDPPHVLSTGGGAYMAEQTRALMRAKAITVWLRADLEVLFDRVRRRGHRPLLRGGDPKEILGRLLAERYPVYAEADIVVESTAQPVERTTEEVIDALRRYLLAQAEGAPA